ncbi:MAG: type II secretion system inner membrane protein GspF [Bdellovibrionales bacterium]|nr:type II secretion system inner membrane protein GspF [Bdellovibrionales bacterium]
MPIYDYKAYGPGGKSVRGVVDAENVKAARAKLKKQGISVYEIGEKSGGGTKSSGGGPSVPQQPGLFAGKLGVKDVAMMTRQLASLIKANIQLVEALGAMVEQSEHPLIKITLSQVRQDVNEGLSLSKAMAKHPRVFDTIFVNMVEAGEASGTLSLILLRLADLKEAQMRLRTKIVSGMTYPALMLFVATVLMIAIFTFVLPQLKTVFESMNKKMPPMTVMLMSTSDIVVTYWYLILGGIVFGLFSFVRWKNSKAGRPSWDAIKLKIPIFGPLIRMIGVQRFTSTMATLLGSGVPILNAMTISRNLVGNTLLANAIGNARENITEGQSIAGPLSKSGQFPPLVIHMISIGEKTGELPAMLTNVSENYEEQVSSRIDGLTSLLEPMMIVGMGGMVGFIVLSVFMPLLDLSNIN